MHRTKNFFYCKNCGTSSHIQEDGFGVIYCERCGTFENIKVRFSKIKHFLSDSPLETITKYVEKKKETVKLKKVRDGFEELFKKSKDREVFFSVTNGLEEFNFRTKQEGIKALILKELNDRVRELMLELWELERGIE